MPSFVDGKFYDDDGKELTREDLVAYGIQIGKYTEPEINCVGCHRPRDNHKSHPTLCPVCLVNQAILMGVQQVALQEGDAPKAVCERFVGKREWGIGPAEPWRRCVSCGQTKAQHELPSCKGVVNIAGVSYGCELNEPHDGWGHSNKEAQAVWM